MLVIRHNTIILSFFYNQKEVNNKSCDVKTHKAREDNKIGLEVAAKNKCFFFN